MKRIAMVLVFVLCASACFAVAGNMEQAEGPLYRVAEAIQALADNGRFQCVYVNSSFGHITCIIIDTRTGETTVRRIKGS